MKIFIIGYSNSGKSTFAKQFKKFKHISASSWTSRFGFDKTDPSYRRNVTEASTKALKENPDECIDHIKEAIKTAENVVIEGIRNPRDFFNLFNPTCDVVMFLKPEGIGISNQFDMGVNLIQDSVAWMANCGIIGTNQFIIEDCHKLEETIKLYNKEYNTF